MAKHTTFSLLVLLSLLMGAYGQAQFNCDDARKLGTSASDNKCTPLCAEVVKRQPSYAMFSGMCKSMCAQCVAAVQSCTPGAQQPLPQQCRGVQNFPVVLGVINDYLKQQTSTEKGRTSINPPAVSTKPQAASGTPGALSPKLSPKP